MAFVVKSVMASPKLRTAIGVGIGILIVVLAFTGIGIFIYKAHVKAAQARALAELKENNPVEYYVLHTPLTMNENDLRHALVGQWQLVGAKSRRTGDFVTMMQPQNFHKTFTLTNWTVVTYDNDSNVLYSASGHYTLRGENYTESIEDATGSLTRYIGAHPKFRIRLDDDKYYQMGAGQNPSVEEMWQRVGD